MRIVSLVPSATESLFELGLGDRVAAVTHECDHPPKARSLPQATSSVLPAGLAPAEVDARVRELVGRGEAIYELDGELLAVLEPDLIVTQAVCEVCAVSVDDVRAVAAGLRSRPHVLSLDPTRLDEVFSDLERLAEAAGVPGRGAELASRLRARVDAVRAATEGREPRAVCALEWLDPPFAAGHWIGELVEAGGGRDQLGRIGERSRDVGWDEVAGVAPEVVISMPCGLARDESVEHARAYRERLVASGASECYAVDAAASFSRPGPRLADGAELVGHLLNPDLVADPGTIGWARVELGADD